MKEEMQRDIFQLALKAGETAYAPPGVNCVKFA